jgi:superfamily II DNA or RNA helicase
MITTREEAATQAVRLAKLHNNLILQWATGLGKSKAAIDIIKDSKPKTILLVVAEVAHKDNWYEEFIKWNAEKYWLNVTIDCYASLKLHRDKKYDMLILDEGHHSDTEIRTDILSSMEVNKVLVLSATLGYDKINILESIFGKFHKFSISLSYAIDNELLPTPKIYLIPLSLDIKRRDLEIVFKRGKEKNYVYKACLFNDRWKYISKKKEYPNLHLTIMCTQREKYQYLSDQFEYYKGLYLRSRQEFQKVKWLQTGSERKRFLGNIKTAAVEYFLENLSDKRYICFCASIEQAEKLGKEYCIHSERKDSQEVIDKFNKKEIDHLYAVNMLQEGQNLKDIEAGIIVQLDGAERAFIQKFGRTLRADSPEQYIFYYKNTRDEEYLEKALQDINANYITKLEL